MSVSVDTPSYVFGVVPADARLPVVEETGPAEQLRLVPAGPVAAVVGTPPASRPLGQAADLLTHDQVIAALVAAGTPVLPMRFGSVLPDDAAVVDDVLTARGETLRADLDRVGTRVQFTITARYQQEVVLRDLLAKRPDIAQLRGSDDPALRLRLGELVVAALEGMRPADAQALLDELPDVVDVLVRKTNAPDDVLNAAVLVERDAAPAFESRLEQIAERHHPRLRIRLAGPAAAYDFVGTR